MIVIQPTVTVLQFGPDIQSGVFSTSTSVTPNVANQGQTINVTVVGQNYVNSTTFNFGSGITVSNLVIVNANTATMTLTLSSTALLGSHDLTTINPFGSTVLHSAFLVNPLPPVPGTGDFFDYIFQFPDQGSFQRDPIIQLAISQFSPVVSGTQAGVQLLIYNPVETLQQPVPTSGNALVLPPQLAQSTVPLPGFWAMVTLQSPFPIPVLTTHPNIQIINDRTLMFGRHPSVLLNKIDVSHINIIINIFGVYVTDGLMVIPSGLQSQPVPMVFG